jgi:hypothetical protein
LLLHNKKEEETKILRFNSVTGVIDININQDKEYSINKFGGLQVILNSSFEHRPRGALLKSERWAEHWWFTSVIQATWEVEIRRIMVWGQLRQIVCKALSQKCPMQTRAGGGLKW